MKHVQFTCVKWQVGLYITLCDPMAGDAPYICNKFLIKSCIHNL